MDASPIQISHLGLVKKSEYWWALMVQSVVCELLKDISWSCIVSRFLTNMSIWRVSGGAWKFLKSHHTIDLVFPFVIF